MNSEAMDDDYLNDDPKSSGRKKSGQRKDDQFNVNSKGKGPKEDTSMGHVSLDMLKIFARYKAGDLNEKAAREVAEVFRELSDASLTIRAGNTNGQSNDTALKDDVLNVRENFSDLKDDYYSLKDDYFDLKDDYFSLRESYFNIKDEHTVLKAGYAKLKELYEHDLEEEKTRIRNKLKFMQRRLRVYFLLFLMIVLLTTPPSIDLISKLFGLH
ncbi:hypothetical protein [Candidatus Magnetominusculus xianensis]|uniref:Uncharacterized protein n=1 Tax=Candidatus Magnetominusculus xianensis TaxID=1748249 RepID=A0ABR5SH27_9BACT|nr:hypothetical protein [Candidatus Magnetominusculus xianensis]KWT90999.1 hypothetical protein ASN18_0946 [Candidatus Magnetominusculus xianensis]MBF0402608.1 hypothetical protein [Nitrospirota bacterium]